MACHKCKWAELEGRSCLRTYQNLWKNTVSLSATREASYTRLAVYSTVNACAFVHTLCITRQNIGPNSLMFQAGTVSAGLGETAWVRIESATFSHWIWCAATAW